MFWHVYGTMSGIDDDYSTSAVFLSSMALISLILCVELVVCTFEEVGNSSLLWLVQCEDLTLSIVYNYFDQIPSLFPPNFFLPKFMCPFFFLFYSLPHWVHVVHGCWTIYFSMGSLWEVTSLRKTDSLFLSGHQIPIFPWVCVGLYELLKRLLTVTQPLILIRLSALIQEWGFCPCSQVAQCLIQQMVRPWTCVSLYGFADWICLSELRPAPGFAAKPFFLGTQGHWS